MLNDQESRNSYIASGSAVFAYTFRIEDAAHLSVYLGSVLQTKDTHYTVSGVGDSGGGNVTFVTAPAAGSAVIIARNQPASQLDDYVPNTTILRETLELGLDKIVMLAQELRERLGRTLRFPVTSNKKDLYVDDPVAGNLLQWKTDLTGIQNATFPTTSTPVGTLQRVTEAQRLALSVDAGTLVEQTDGTNGIWLWNGTAWINIGGLTGVQDITKHGAKGDALTVSDGAITAADKTLTSATGMTGIAAGMLVEVEGAGAAGVLLVTTVASVTSENEVELTDAASTTVSGAHVGFGTNNATALHDAIVAANPGGLVLIPPGTFYVSSNWSGSPALLSGLNGVTVMGTGWGSVLKWLHPTDGSNGQVIRYELSTNLRFTNFSIDLNNGRRASKSAFGIHCIDGGDGIEIFGMHFFSSRATAAVTGGDKDQYAVLFGAPVTSHKNIHIHHNFVEDEHQFEVHLKALGVKINDNIMVNEVAAPKTTAAIWIGTEVNTGGDIQDVEIARNLIKGYSNRAMNLIHNGVDNSGSIKRAKVHDNMIMIGRAGSGGNVGILVGVGNTSLTYNQAIVMDDIEVYDNLLVVDTTADFPTIRFNNNQTNTGFFFERPVIRGNRLVRLENLDNSSNDGINVQDARRAIISHNHVTGSRFGFRLGVQASEISYNYHLGVADPIDSVNAFNGIILSGTENRLTYNRFEGAFDDVVIWLVGGGPGGTSEVEIIGNRIQASAGVAGIKIDNVSAVGLRVEDNWISGVTTGITRNGSNSTGRARVSGTIFGGTPPTTFFVVDTPHATDIWQLAERIQAETVADSGDGNPGALTVIPHYKFIHVTGSDADGNELTISEAEAAIGMEFWVMNVGSNDVTVLRAGGIVETPNNANVVLPAGTLAKFRYEGLTWRWIGGHVGVTANLTLASVTTMNFVGGKLISTT